MIFIKPTCGLLLILLKTSFSLKHWDQLRQSTTKYLLNYYQQTLPSVPTYFKQTITVNKSTCPTTYYNMIQYEMRNDGDFETKESKLQFIRKVYNSYGFQQLVIIILTAIVSSNVEVFMTIKHYLKSFLFSCIVGMTSIASTLIFRPSSRYETPTNVILIGLFNALQGGLVTCFSVLLNPKMVCYGTIHNLSAYLSVLLYSYQNIMTSPQLDTSNLIIFIICGISSIFVGILLTVHANISLMDNMISAAIAVGLNISVISSARSIIDGTNEMQPYSPKEYILASLNPFPTILSYVTAFAQTEQIEKKS